MTNKEKAKDIVRNKGCVYSVHGKLKDPISGKTDIYDSALEMARWKDAQFKEYLRDRLDSLKNCCVCCRSADFYEGMVETLDEIINELFGE